MQRHVGGRFFLVLTVAQLLLFVAIVPLLRRARTPNVPRRLFRLAEILLVAAALAVPAALVADVVPWWRWGHPTLVFTASQVAILAVVTTAVSLATWRVRRPTPGALRRRVTPWHRWAGSPLSARRSSPSTC